MAHTRCEVIKGDYRQHLPKRSDCFVVTDPPYNVGFDYPDHDDNLSDAEYFALLAPLRGYKAAIINYPEVMLRTVVPALGTPRKCAAWVYNANIPHQWRMIAWFNCEPNLSLVKQPYKNMNDSRILEMIENGSEGCDLYDWWNVELVKNVSPEKWDYVNQIPEEIIRRILLTTVPLGGLVFEPFCGSGTVPVVARRFGYPCIATDISEKAIQVAQARLNVLEFPLAEGA